MIKTVSEIVSLNPGTACAMEAAWPVGGGRIGAIFVGGAAGMVEMLMQIANRAIDLLPTLPKAWPNGSMTGLRAHGGCEVDVTWEDGQMTGSKIKSIQGGKKIFAVGCGNRVKTFELKSGGELAPGSDL